MSQSTDIFNPKTWGREGAVKKSGKKTSMVMEIPIENSMKESKSELFKIGKVDFGKMSISEFARPGTGSKNSLAITRPKMTINPVRFTNPKTNKKYGASEAKEVHEDVEEAFEMGDDIDESKIKVFEGKRYYPMDG